MIKSNFIKLIMSFLLITLLINIFYIPTSQAIGDIMQSGKGFLDAADSDDSDDAINTTTLKNTSDYLYNVLLAIGIVVAVIVAMVLGIQFMTASAGEKAKVKEALIPFVAGCIIVFGAFTIWKIAVTIGTNAENKVKVSTTTKKDESTTTKKDESETTKKDESTTTKKDESEFESWYNALWEKLKDENDKVYEKIKNANKEQFKIWYEDLKDYNPSDKKDYNDLLTRLMSDY